MYYFATYQSFFLKTHYRVAARPFSQAAKGPKSAWCEISYSQVSRTFSAIVIKRHPAFDHCTRILARARLRFVEGGGDNEVFVLPPTSIKTVGNAQPGRLSKHS
jgi:hypothetical protein